MELHIEIADFPKARIVPPKSRERIKWLQPLNEPIWHSASDSEHMKPDDPVLGLELNNQAWAFPWWIMKNHHVANLILDNQPILVMLCEMCSSAAAMKPIIQGKRYTFRVVGTYNGTFLISDYETNSFWEPFKGEAVYGSLKGTTLKQIPLYQCLWSEWLAQYPTTSVLYGEQPWRKGHGSAHSPGSPGIPITMSYTMLRPIDDRLPHNTLVLGVRSNDETKAYPLIGLDRTSAVVNDTLGETEIAIFHPPGTLQAIAFSRHLGKDVLIFEQTAAGEIMDRNTGSYWSYTGLAYQGKHKGDRLSFVASSVLEWFVWAAEYPDTEIFETADFSRLLCFAS